VNVFASKRTREQRSIAARLDRLEHQQELLARDLAEAEKRIEALEAERERIAPCPK